MGLSIMPVHTEEQLRSCFAVRIRVFVEEQGVAPEEEMDDYDASPSAARHFLIMNGNEPAAAARWIMYDGKTAKLQRIAVMKPYRGQGIGRQIIQAMEEDVRAQGVPAVILDAQTQAEAFYEKLGYRTISDEPFLDAGIWHVRMRKEL
ncbi:GNAT family N-acetyltransferase [Paenibacillus ehimensis]|uniref:GNAT family N-acetyltransferase n=1 Tax=Paenibacillus ehimensis TaxID=79264 RepID=A0ABT8V8R3_9BACL|nr:GNAT family N-acetyltransferase [Paenibacillus ehimensis]MDO3677238.1 GNAT family N-acetyltransferase [Paenibacillus ehimensis]MEC0210716.1 GNAT family N-acetyltransferase [Paenibacillus ehimensis]